MWHKVIACKRRWLMVVFTEEQVFALAPDDGSAKSGRDLANPRKWVNLGASESAIWGECQGSGARPYQTCIDASQPAFKCTCPSRKFPCKHGLALLLMHSRAALTISIVDPPDWVSKWLQSRGEKQEKKTRKNEDGESAPDPVAKAKRQADRAAKVEAGLSEFSLWLQDRIRQGIAGLDGKSNQFWENAAARLTDAQAPGLARMLRQCVGIPNSGEGWQSRLLERLSLLHLAVEGYKNIGELPAELQQEIRNVVGFTTSQEEVLKQDGVSDRFQIVGQRVEVEDRLKVQRTWLRGENSGQWALILNFAHGMQPLDVTLVPGFVVQAELAYFPGALKLRALVKKREEVTEQFNSFLSYRDGNEFLRAYAAALAVNPWLENFPVAIDGVTVRRLDNGKFAIIDAASNMLTLGITEGVGWQIMALTGGHTFALFGEYNGETLLPLSVLSNGTLSRVDLRAGTNVN